MRIQRSSSEEATPAREDDLVQQAVVLSVIDLHPAHMTVSELIRLIAHDPFDFGEADRIERAVKDLAGIGLLHRHDFRNRPDSLVAPTKAALVAHALFLDNAEED